MQVRGLTAGLRPGLRGLDISEAGGIPGGAVECVDIGKNTGGEGGQLGNHRRCGSKARVANRIRYPGSPRRKRCALGARGFLPLGAGANAISAPPGEYARKGETQRN